MTLKKTRMLFGAAAALYFLWVGSLIAMAVYSAKKPPEQIMHQMPEAASSEGEDSDTPQ